jgi:selenocysteine lyase/cysteine desulfurase
VFVGPFEHHSNILPWREAGAKVIRIGEAEDGTVDLEDLELQLKVILFIHLYTCITLCASV